MVLSCRSTGHWLRVCSRARPLPITTIRSYSDGPKATPKEPDSKPVVDDHDVRGPMTRRLEEATEEALLSGGRAGRRAVEDAGFNDELKNRLLSKIADAKFLDEHDTALREAGLVGGIPETAGQGSREIASAQPWTGTESQSDAVLRMLNDAHKPLAPGSRGKARVPLPQSIPVDMRIKRQASINKGQKVAVAREAASVYVGMGIKDKDKQGLDDEQRQALRKELRERFEPAARAMPNTLSGLAALANERIEDAIARGQFKHIPRGPGVERDTRADNPFIDTTEYIMNKMIKKQDIVPPWIEKQQELVKAANVFRARLRSDWKRHASRMIASHGGSLEEQMKRAEAHARAEEVYNPRRKKTEQVSVPTNITDDVVMHALRQEALPEPLPAEETPVQEPPPPPPPAVDEPEPLVKPFRDATWEATEKSYMELAITNLNTMTRAYNLMAPELAKKPYYSLERELKACFADVAPQIANEIKERARRPEKSLLNQGGHQSGSLLDRFARESRSAKVYDSRTPHYGFKEMWRDLWQRPA